MSNDLTKTKQAKNDVDSNLKTKILGIKTIILKPDIHAKFLSKWDFFEQFSAQWYVKWPN